VELVPCGMSVSGGIVIASRLGKPVAWQIHLNHNAAAGDLMIQHFCQIERTRYCRAKCSQPDSFSNTMQLHVVHGSGVLVKGLSSFQVSRMRGTSGLMFKPVMRRTKALTSLSEYGVGNSAKSGHLALS
jgi:hypothetical protein